MPPTPQRSSPPAPLRPPADGPVAPSSGPTPAPTPPEQPPAAREAVEPPRVAASARTPSPNPAPPATSAAGDSARREDGGAAGARTATDATGHAADGVRGSHGRGGGVGAVGGDRLALAVPGSGDGGPGTEYGAYLSRLRERLQQTLRYPPIAQRRGITGTVQLDIAIEPDGAVSSVSLASSSSHDALDRAALDAARALGRQPFPADVRARPLEVRVPVTFRLQ
jgi:protein TonB